MPDAERNATMNRIVPVEDPALATAVGEFLAAPEPVVDAVVRGVRVPIVDEAEAERLAARGAGAPAPRGWQAWCALENGRAALAASVTAYASAHSSDGGAVGELVAAPGSPACGPLLDRLAVFAPAGLELWIRNCSAAMTDRLRDAGLVSSRRLAVLGRPTTRRRDRRPAADVSIRPAVLARDADAVVAVLAAAYRNTPEAGWDRAQFDARARAGWFRAEDLLLAEDRAGEVVGVAWLKRRAADVGEIYNLAVHPRAHGRGVGAALLAAGLDHLGAAGLAIVVLWVDTANTRAVSLYEAAGFAEYWSDVSFVFASGVLGAS